MAPGLRIDIRCLMAPFHGGALVNSLVLAGMLHYWLTPVRRQFSWLKFSVLYGMDTPACQVANGLRHTRGRACPAGPPAVACGSFNLRSTSQITISRPMYSVFLRHRKLVKDTSPYIKAMICIRSFLFRSFPFLLIANGSQTSRLTSMRDSVFPAYQILSASPSF